MVERIDPQYLLEWAGGIRKSYPFIDFHVHPFDVFIGDIGYQPDPINNGLYVKGSSVYKPPSIDFKDEFIIDQFTANPGNSRAMLLASRLLYTHTGPKVFTDQLDLAGITGALLLPVVRKTDEAMNMVEMSVKMFQQENRLFLACPFPMGISPPELIKYYRSVHETHKICAIKIHPNLVGIDPLSDVGKDLIEATLEAAGECKFSVVLHGGVTSGLLTSECSGYGTLDRLANINWSTSACPVIFAHAGCYGLSEDEMISVLPILNRLMDKYPNLFADVSALPLPALQLLLRKVDRNRLIFGSDALYFKIWKAWIIFLHALQAISPDPNSDLIRIASTNPAQCLQYSGYSLSQAL